MLMMAAYGICVRQGCGTPLGARQLKYCSSECSRIARRKDRGKCPCGNPLGRSQRAFCSRTCSNKSGNNSNPPHSKDIRRTVCEVWLNEPETSAAKIGQRFGLTKNAVIGIVRRANMPQRAPYLTLSPEQMAARLEAIRATRSARDAERRRLRAMTDAAVERERKKPRQKIEAPKRPPVPPAPIASPFKTCQWALNDRRPWEFCCAATVPGRPYCDEHCRRAYVRRVDLLVREAA